MVARPDPFRKHKSNNLPAYAQRWGTDARCSTLRESDPLPPRSTRATEATVARLAEDAEVGRVIRPSETPRSYMVDVETGDLASR